jgi:PAS domain S-box-containing protein
MTFEESHGIRLLLVEDDLDFRTSLTARLRKRGFEVTEAVSAEEAMEALDQEVFDVVVSDIKLPGTDGMEFLAMVKQRDGELPVVLVTGYASLESAKEAVTLNASDYLLKPLDSIEDLLRPIHKAVHSRKLEALNREAQQEIRRLKEHFESIVTSVPCGILTIEPSGEIREANDTFRGMMDCGRSEIEGRYINDVFDMSVAQEFADLMEADESRDVPRYFEWNAGEALGRQFWAEVVLKRADIGGRHLVLMVVSDISDIKQAEEEKKDLEERMAHMRKMEALGKMAGGVAHDFNNILTAIQGYSDLAMSGLESDSPVFWQLKQISEASVRGSNLTQQLLLFGHKQPIEFIPCDVNRRVRGILPMLEHLAGGDVLIVTELSPEPVTVSGDGSKVEMLLMNLVINARDAMPGGGQVTVKTSMVGLGEEFCRDVPDAEPGRYACLSVADDGTGMDEDTVKNIFDPFFTTKREGKGTGLGLSVVYGIVKEHKGWIRVASRVGEGSVFKVYLPASEEAPTEEEDDDIPADALQGEGERVLVVEDEEGTRGFLEKALSTNGYEVFAAPSAGEARTLFESKNGEFHMIFSDVVLPDGNGLDLSKKLQTASPKLKILLGSGYCADESVGWEEIEAQGVPLIQKPYSLGSVLRAVKETISREDLFT